MIQKPFYLRDKASDSVKALLFQTVLGSNGARYQHLNTAQIIEELDHPQFLSLERNGKALGNIAFCRRKGHWYIRYFAFAGAYQTEQKGHSPEKGNGLFKKGIAAFFEQTLQNKAQSFYAYVDPSNSRSKWMCENFGFKPIAQLRTQAFSRSKPKLDPQFERLMWNDEVQSQLNAFSAYAFELEQHAPRCHYGVLRGADGQIEAFAKYQTAHWRIERLPGKMGGLMVKVIPYLPFLNRVFKPNDHRFIVPEAVFAKNNDPELVKRLFESILAKEQHQLMLWWMDEREPIWTASKNKVRWGLMHRILGNPPVTVYARFSTQYQHQTDKLIYVSGMDLI